MKKTSNYYTADDLAALIGCCRARACRVFRLLGFKRSSQNKRQYRLNRSQWVRVMIFLASPEGLIFGRHNPYRTEAQKAEKPAKSRVFSARDLVKQAEVSYPVARAYLILIGAAVPGKKAKLDSEQFGLAVAVLQDCSLADPEQPLRVLGVSVNQVKRMALSA